MNEYRVNYRHARETGHITVEANSFDEVIYKWQGATDIPVGSDIISIEKLEAPKRYTVRIHLRNSRLPDKPFVFYYENPVNCYEQDVVNLLTATGILPLNEAIIIVDRVDVALANMVSIYLIDPPLLTIEKIK
jgi:hypothetical protein